MKTGIEYLIHTTADANLPVEDIGHVAIVAGNDFGKQWYIIINTFLGWAKIEEFGPLVIDCNEFISKEFSYTYDEIEYSEFKLSRRLEKFLQEPRRCITQASVIDEAEARDRFFAIKFPSGVS